MAQCALRHGERQRPMHAVTRRCACGLGPGCLDNCSWTLFMNTVHEVFQKKKSIKNIKFLFEYDLIYEMFILHYL